MNHHEHRDGAIEEIHLPGPSLVPMFTAIGIAVGLVGLIFSWPFVALGGLMQLEVENGRSGIPGAQDVPGIGGLFGNRARNTVKKELVILIKPTIIKSEADWEQDITATGDRLRGMGDGTPAPTPRSQ